MKLTPEDKKYFDSRKKKTALIVKELKKEGINPQKKIKVLEVGCNHGFIAYIMSKKTKWDMYGGDLNKKNLFKYSWIREKVKLSVLDATQIKFKNETFDLVILNHVIEHIPKWGKTIDEIYRVLKKGGVLYLATPNLHRKLVGTNVLLAKKKNLPKKKRIEHHMGFSHEELKILLKGFSNVKNINKEHFVNNISFPLKTVIKTFPKKFHEKYGQTNVFIARK